MVSTKLYRIYVLQNSFGRSKIVKPANTSSTLKVCKPVLLSIMMGIVSRWLSESLRTSFLLWINTNRAWSTSNRLIKFFLLSLRRLGFSILRLYISNIAWSYCKLLNKFLWWLSWDSSTSFSCDFGSSSFLFSFIYDAQSRALIIIKGNMCDFYDKFYTSA